MSKKIDSLMNVIAVCRADAIADRMMIEALLYTHPDLKAAKDAWKQLLAAHHRDRLFREVIDNLDRASETEEEEAFSAWKVKLSLAVTQRKKA